MKSSDIVIVGGVACGPKTAAVLGRRLTEATITLFQKEEYLSYASCGMPWLASGDLEGPEALLQTAWRTVRDSEFFHKTKRFESRTGTEVIEIDREARTITVRDSSGQTEQHGYGTLVLATG
ncbi:pyridine nucleotide-disulfide oxidoreductase, partial [candidate division GN15 bacterium]|nr:pyridine nucleotide-disulfide oxidoreductase [candidate division GN15 bacterium]